MYDIILTWLKLPSGYYRMLFGIAISITSSNNGFLIGNIINSDNTYSRYELIDKK